AAGICAGVSTFIQQLVPGWADSKTWTVVINLLGLINSSFLAYLTAWAGYRAAEKFGGTPILGGMLGMITGLAQINTISAAVGLYNDASPLDAILRAGRGGVLAAVIGVWVLVKVEKAVRSKMPDSLDIVFTPLLSLLITLIPYIFIVMPLTGLISTGLCKVVEFFCMSPSAIVRILAGFISSALFLPMVAMGMHHGLVALYTVQLNTLGYVTLYPALAMAGAGQVGAALAIYLKCKKVQNNRLKSVITGALPAGVLGVGEPLIYGVTLPMGKPFITAGLGAGFGGAFVMAMQVAATTWGPSGLLAVFVMTAGPQGAFNSVLFYVIGLVISYIMGFIITNIFVKDEEVAQA
ncbi:MAG: PTS transporter subunit EIIC, partial [Solobacterium sp.]|nr:PTS transporter subunit EIIC [Solobacterium sp.]